MQISGRSPHCFNSYSVHFSGELILFFMFDVKGEIEVRFHGWHGNIQFTTSAINNSTITQKKNVVKLLKHNICWLVKVFVWLFYSICFLSFLDIVLNKRTVRYTTIHLARGCKYCRSIAHCEVVRLRRVYAYPNVVQHESVLANMFLSIDLFVCFQHFHAWPNLKWNLKL